jgi:hypothetical protein
VKDLTDYKKGEHLVHKSGEVYVSDGSGNFMPTGLTEKAYNSMDWKVKVGRGIMDVGQGIKQGAYWLADAVTDDETSQMDEKFKDYTSKVDSDIALYEKGRKATGDEGMDWWRLGGQVAGTLPLGLMSAGKTVAGQVGKGMLQGGLAGGSLYTEGGDLGTKAMNVGFGTAGGAAAPFAAKGIAAGAGATAKSVSNLYRNLKPKNMQQVNIILKQRFAQDGIDFDTIPLVDKKALLKSAREQLSATGALDADALVRKARAESLGFVDDAAPTMPQVTRSPQAWTREKNLSKLENVGDDIVNRYKAQDAKFNELGDDLARGTGGKAKDVAETNESIYTAIRGKWNDTQQEVGKIYKAIGDKYGDVDVDMGGVGRFLDDNDWDETAAPVVKSVINKLKKHDIIDADGAFTGETLPLKVVESIRKDIGNRFASSKDPNIARLGREAISALDETAVTSVGDDAFSTARQAAAKRFADFESKVGNTMKKITGETMSEDDAFTSVLRAKSEELQAIKDNLIGKNIPDATGQGTQAWRDFQQETVKSLWETANRTGKFSGATFKKEIDKIGRKKLEIIFGKERTKRLYDIAKTGVDFTKDPPWSSVNYSNTTPTLMNLMGDLKIPYLSKMARDSANQIEKQVYLSGSPINKGIPSGNIDAAIQRRFTNPVTPYAGGGAGLLTGDLGKSLLE